MPQDDSQGADNHQTNQRNSGHGQHAARIGGARGAGAAFRLEAILDSIDSGATLANQTAARSSRNTRGLPEASEIAMTLEPWKLNLVPQWMRC